MEIKVSLRKYLFIYPFFQYICRKKPKGSEWKRHKGSKKIVKLMIKKWMQLEDTLPHGLPLQRFRFTIFFIE